MQSLPEPFFAARTTDGRRAFLKLGGDCDAAALDALNEALADIVAQPAAEIMVDLEKTTFVDSLALGALTAAAKRVRAQGRNFQVVSPSPASRRAMEITGLGRYLLAAAAAKQSS